LQPRQFYEFGPYRIETALSRLLRRGMPVLLPPKAFDLLLLLVRNPKRVLPKAELMGALWPDTFVEDANLTQHVFTLRKVLGIQENGEPYIETVPRRGYCFAADVREAVESEAPLEAAREKIVEPPREAVTISIDGERKQATVLHCGIANAAPLAERLGPAGLHDLLGRVSELAADEIGRYEGIVRQRRADEFVALFGARVVHEDDARRAVLAALGLRRRIGELLPGGTPDDERSVVRIGIHSGPVVVSRRADDRGVEYSAVGETMRVADLLQQLADPDTILVSEAARRAVEAYVQLEPVPIDARVAGTLVFRVIGIAPDAAWRLARLTRTLAPFVGRRYEVALLQDLAVQALAGKGQVVSIVGEPGMGKSRLVHEFSQAVAAGGPVTLLEGRSVSYGSLVPYLPLADLIRALCGVGESDTPENIRSAIERTIRDTDLPADVDGRLLRPIGIVETPSALDTLSPEALLSLHEPPLDRPLRRRARRGGPRGRRRQGDRRSASADLRRIHGRVDRGLARSPRCRDRCLPPQPGTGAGSRKPGLRIDDARPSPARARSARRRACAAGACGRRARGVWLSAVARVRRSPNGRMLPLQGRLEEASAFVTQGLQAATRAQYWYVVGIAHRVAGRIARDRGDADEARRALKLALDTFARIGAQFEAARTRLDLALEAGSVGNRRRAREEIAAAPAVFDALGVSAYRDRAVELAGRIGVSVGIR